MQNIKLLLVLAWSLFLLACVSNKNMLGPENKGLGIQAGFDGQGLDYTRQQLLTQKTILFAFDKTNIKQQYLPIIQAHAQYLQENPSQTVLLVGNTDKRGSREYNMGLGERRAQSVADVLMSNGISATQIVEVSYGPEVPVACGQSQAAYAQNRRVDILYCKIKNCRIIAKNYAKKLCTVSEDRKKKVEGKM